MKPHTVMSARADTKDTEAKANSSVNTFESMFLLKLYCVVYVRERNQMRSGRVYTLQEQQSMPAQTIAKRDRTK